MTGTNKYLIMSRKPNMEHDYLSGTGIVKSKTSIGMSVNGAHSNPHTHKSLDTHISKDSNNNININQQSSHHHFYSKRRERSSAANVPNSKNGHQLATTKSGGTNTSTSVGEGIGTAQQSGPKKHRNRQRNGESNSKTVVSKSRPKDDATILNHDVMGSPLSSSMLPPINFQLPNNASPQPQPIKNGEKSPRNLESSAANNSGAFSLAPSRMALRQSVSPDLINNQSNVVNNSISNLHPNQANNNNSNKQDTINENTSHQTTSSMKNTSTPHAQNNNGRKSSLTITIKDPNIIQHQVVRSLTSNHIQPSPSSPQPSHPISPKIATEHSRFSPVHSNDKPKTKFEKRVMKSIIDSNNNNHSSDNNNNNINSPRASRLTPGNTENANETSTSRDGKPHLNPQQRKSSVRSLPKLVEPEDQQFSIRRKIEQFKKWHEEQMAADNMKRLPNGDVSEGTGSGRSKTKNRNGFSKAERFPSTNSNADMTDYAKILEDKIIENNQAITGMTKTENTVLLSKNITRTVNGNEINDINDNLGNNDDKNNEMTVLGNKISSRTDDREDLRAKKTARIGAKRIMNAKNRPVSGATWKTWRDVNQSDAYNDVNKYIIDNELMDDERADWIRAWLRDVRVAMDDNIIDTVNV